MSQVVGKLDGESHDEQRHKRRHGDGCDPRWWNVYQRHHEHDGARQNVCGYHVIETYVLETGLVYDGSDPFDVSRHDGTIKESSHDGSMPLQYMLQ